MTVCMCMCMLHMTYINYSVNQWILVSFSICIVWSIPWYLTIFPACPYWTSEVCVDASVFVLQALCCFVCCGVPGGTTFPLVLWVSATSPAATACQARVEGSLFGVAMPLLHLPPPSDCHPRTWAARPPLPPLLTWAPRSTQHGMKWPMLTWITCHVRTHSTLYTVDPHPTQNPWNHKWVKYPNICPTQHKIANAWISFARI